MILNKPKFWDSKKSFLSTILYPISILFIILIFLRNIFSKSKKFNIPIICVGNIYVGGTGKTPTSIFLANQILNSGKNPVIIRKYYKSHKDEHALIKENFKNLILCSNRIQGLIEAEAKKYDVAILDDGFQDCKIEKHLNIICFNSNQLIGNGYVFPSGPLRETLKSLRYADIIIINGKKNEVFERKILDINKNLKIFYSLYKPINLDKFKDNKLLALAAIGNPENFFQLLEENNLEVHEKLIFPDHYIFTKNQVLNIMNHANQKNLKIIMTEKDYYKIKNFNLPNFEFLKVKLEIKNSQKFFETIEKLYDKKI